MNPTAKSSQEYLRGAVLTASPEQLHLMLYDGAIKFVTRGLEAIQAQDRESAFNAFDRAQRIVLELTNGIHREVNPALADRMGAIYNFIYRRLIDANLHSDAEAANDALRLLRYQRETWLMLLEKLRQELHAEPRPEAGTTPGAPSAFAVEG
jgi:flagellar secretion chaperone FliS